MLNKTAVITVLVVIITLVAFIVGKIGEQPPRISEVNAKPLTGEPLPAALVTRDYNLAAANIEEGFLVMITIPHFDSIDSLDAGGYIAPLYESASTNFVSFVCWGIGLDVRTNVNAFQCGPYYGDKGGDNHNQPFLIWEADMMRLFRQYGAYALMYNEY